jgi:hypothetical protein
MELSVIKFKVTLGHLASLSVYRKSIPCGIEIRVVGAGKSADLVILEANPLDDIHNAARISAVILQGQILKGGTEAR